MVVSVRTTPASFWYQIGAALDAAGIALHQHAMAGGGLDVEHDVGLLGQCQRPPGDMAHDHFAVAGWRGRWRQNALQRSMTESRFFSK